MKQVIIRNQATAPPLLTVVTRAGKQQPTYELLDLKLIQPSAT